MKKAPGKIGGTIIADNNKYENSFDNEKTIYLKENEQENYVTNKKYQKKIDNVKNEKIKRSLLELTKVFKEK